jgi:hypothetical protein
VISLQFDINELYWTSRYIRSLNNLGFIRHGTLAIKIAAGQNKSRGGEISL